MKHNVVYHRIHSFSTDSNKTVKRCQFEKIDRVLYMYSSEDLYFNIFEKENKGKDKKHSYC